MVYCAAGERAAAAAALMECYETKDWHWTRGPLVVVMLAQLVKVQTCAWAVVVGSMERDKAHPVT